MLDKCLQTKIMSKYSELTGRIIFQLLLQLALEGYMKAMILNEQVQLVHNSKPLQLIEMPVPTPEKNEVLLKVNTCGVCHTELDEIEGRTPPSRFPIIPGHQIVGTVEAIGEEISGIRIGQRMGVGWIYSSCGKCNFCIAGKENLCSDFLATGRDRNGGYAEYVCNPLIFYIFNP